MHDARRLLTKEQILTIPNAMSGARIVLIPFIIWTYAIDRHYLSVALVALSAISDMLDGFVARKLNMISDFGKFIDPVADKLTQAALLICLMTEHSHIYILFIFLGVKEVGMLFWGALVFSRHDSVNSAKWYGKLCTVVFEGTMIILMVFPNVQESIVHGFIALCAAVMVFSLTMYSLFYLKILLTGGRKKDAN